MVILEPVTMLTDYAIAALCLWFSVGENFVAEATFEFFDVFAKSEDFHLNRWTFATGFCF